MGTWCSLAIIACNIYCGGGGCYYFLKYETQAEHLYLRSRMKWHFYIKKKTTSKLPKVNDQYRITPDIQTPLKVHYSPTLAYGIYFFHMRKDRCTTEITYIHYYSYQVKCHEGVSWIPSNASRAHFTLKEIILLYGNQHLSIIHSTLAMEVNIRR